MMSALGMEARAVRRVLRAFGEEGLNQLRLQPDSIAARGRAALLDVPVIVSGPGTGPAGQARVREAVMRLPDRVSVVIFAGLAGGLREEAAGADGVVVARRVVDEHGGEWRSGGASVDAADDSTVLGVDRIIATPAEKKRLGERTGAAAVDMESAAFARACGERGLEWVVVRAVSDSVNEHLPEEVASWIDDRGRSIMSRVVLDVARRPSLARAVWMAVKCTGPVLRSLGERAATLAEGAVVQQLGGDRVSESVGSSPP